MNESTLDQSQAPIPFRNHTALLLSTALPFIQPSFRHPLELALKFLEFSETLRFYQEFHSGEFPFGMVFPKPEPQKEAGIFGLIDSFVLDIEGLLVGLSKVCTGDGKEIISLFLNLIRAKKFYEQYGEIINSVLGTTEGGLFGSKKEGSSESGGLGSLVNQLSPDLLSLLSLLNPGGIPAAKQGVEKDASDEPNVEIPKDNSNTAIPPTTDDSSSAPDALYMQSLTSMLNEEQKETLDLLKTLFNADAT